MAITKIGTPELFDFSATNTALQLPSGDTASRPSAPSAGEWRYNTEKKYVEYWDGGSPGAWRQIDTEALPLPSDFPSQNFNVNTYFGTGAAQTIDAKFNEAANFNGTDSLITLADSLDSTLGLNNFSYSFWVKGPMTTTWAVWISLAKNAFVYIGYNEGGTGGLMVSTYNDYYKSNITISADTWTHIGFAKSSANGILLTKNGTSTTPYTDTSAAAKADLSTSGSGQSNVIGDYSGGGLPFEGSMDQVRFYNAALDSSDFNYIYTNETATTASQLNPSGFPSGCIAAYQLDGDASDVSGNYNGAVSNVGFTGLQFQPDMIWIKTRNQANDHNIVDSIRGTTKYLRPNRSIAEVTQSDGVTSFDTNGFTVDAGGDFGGSNNEYVAWAFKGGGAPTDTNSEAAGDAPTPDSVLIDGVSSTAALAGATPATNISANTEAGFSIVKYTGPASNSTIAHALGVTPSMIIQKPTGSGSWYVYFAPGVIDATSTYYYMVLDSSAGIGSTSSAAPTTTTFNSAGTGAHMAYCFADIAGYQRISTYTGNASTYGEFVYTTSDGTATGTDGFEPAFLLVKRTTAGQTANWRIVDNKRSTQNPRQIALFPNLSNAEDDDASQRVNFFTNGFQIANSDASWNASGETYLYLAIGSNPAPTPTATNSFDLTTYNGTSSSPQFVTSASLYPQIIWNKQTGGSAAHRLLDQLRGSGNYLYPSEVNANDGYNADYIRFQKDGDDGTVTGLYLPGADSNFNTSEWVNWFWKAGTPSLNNDGTITSITSVNEAAGFSIVQWQGDGNSASTVGHGIAAGAPDFVAYKDSSNSRNWNVYVSSASASYKPFGGTLDLDSAFNTSGGTNGSSGTPTATTLTFTAGSSTVDTVNANAAIMMAYCWKSTTNYVDVGSYIGAIGRTVNVGFQPRFVLIKKVNAAYNWSLYDSIRGSSGALTDRYLIAADANSPQVTSSSVYIDFTSTGLSFPNSYSGTNNTGDEYIYIAFA